MNFKQLKPETQTALRAFSAKTQVLQASMRGKPPTSSKDIDQIAAKAEVNVKVAKPAKPAKPAKLAKPSKPAKPGKP